MEQQCVLRMPIAYETGDRIEQREVMQRLNGCNHKQWRQHRGGGVGEPVGAEREELDKG